MKRRIRVLVVDDSPTMVALLRALLAADGDIDVVAHASDGLEAVQLAKALLPDLVTMDVRMPNLGGIHAIEEIMAEAPSRIVVVCTPSEDSADVGFEAMSVGALELIAKPGVSHGAVLDAWGRELRETVRLMAEIPVVGRNRRGRSLPDVDPGAWAGRALAVGIVASTGGPPALAEVLAQLPADLPVPMFIAQHIAPGFAEALARWLASATRLRVVTVDSAVRVQPASVYLPRDGRDLLLSDAETVRADPSSSAHCPSGDRLLSSLAHAHGPRALGVILTGMGEDGVAGLRDIRMAGGLTLGQDKDTSVVFGMAGAAQRAGVLARTLPLRAIAPAIHGLVRQRRVVQ